MLYSDVLNRVGHEVFPRGSVHLFSIQFLTFFLVLFDFVNEDLSILLVILLLVDLSFSVAHCVYYSIQIFFYLLDALSSNSGALGIVYASPYASIG